jgi:ketosteroid isomerase-like protein
MRNRLLLTITLAASLFFTTACGSSHDTAQADDPTALATELIDQYLLAVFDRDPEALGSLLSEAYLLRRTDGSGYSRQGYMDALAEDSDYAFVDYSINNVSAQQDGDILVAVFTLDAKISENGRSVTSEPRPSLVTFVRVDGEWKLASDAFYS